MKTHSRDEHRSEIRILESLSPKIKAKVSEELYAPIFRQVRAFRSMSHEGLGALAAYFEVEVYAQSEMVTNYVFF